MSDITERARKEINESESPSTQLRIQLAQAEAKVERLRTEINILHANYRDHSLPGRYLDSLLQISNEPPSQALSKLLEPVRDGLRVAKDFLNFPPVKEHFNGPLRQMVVEKLDKALAILKQLASRNTL